MESHWSWTCLERLYTLLTGEGEEGRRPHDEELISQIQGERLDGCQTGEGLGGWAKRGKGLRKTY